MKRIAGASALLLTGLCGCISVLPPAGPEDRKGAGVARRAVESAPLEPAQPPATALADNEDVPSPATSRWRGAPPMPQPAPGEYNVARPTARALPGQPDGMPPPLPPLQRTNAPYGASPLAQPAPPAHASAPTPVVVHPDVPSASTPRSETLVQPASYASEREPSAAITGNRTELTPPPTPAPLPPMPRAVTVPPVPTVKSPPPAETRQAGASSGKGASPLFRLVNTRRITLNFEVKDVGASGLAAVELWFTQDGREWKKHDAPPQAKAYVVEVDEEGMYGFTLLARSGTGLAKDLPQPGDSPQVWVIVDLTKPEVQLNEVTPGLQNGQQVVSVKWRANDKNMSRQPVTLSYAEKEEGPWRVIAAGLDAIGSYTWEVPRDVPAKVLLRAEASDLAGNVGRAQVSKPVLMDNKVPTVKIVEVDANTGQ